VLVVLILCDFDDKDGCGLFDFNLLMMDVIELVVFCKVFVKDVVVWFWGCVFFCAVYYVMWVME